MSALIIITHVDKNGKVKTHKVKQGKLKSGHTGREIDDAIDQLMANVTDTLRRRKTKTKGHAKKK